MRTQIKNFVDQLTKAAAKFSTASAKPASLVTITNTEEIITQLHTLLCLYETLPMKLIANERQALGSEEFIAALALIKAILEQAKGYLYLIAQARSTLPISVFEFRTQFDTRVADARVIQDENEATVALTIEDKAVQALATVNQVYSRAEALRDTTPPSTTTNTTSSVSNTGFNCSLPPLPQAERSKKPVI